MSIEERNNIKNVTQPPELSQEMLGIRKLLTEKISTSEGLLTSETDADKIKGINLHIFDLRLIIRNINLNEFENTRKVYSFAKEIMENRELEPGLIFPDSFFI